MPGLEEERKEMRANWNGARANFDKKEKFSIPDFWFHAHFIVDLRRQKKGRTAHTKEWGGRRKSSKVPKSWLTIEDFRNLILCLPFQPNKLLWRYLLMVESSVFSGCDAQQSAIFSGISSTLKFTSHYHWTEPEKRRKKQHTEQKMKISPRLLVFPQKRISPCLAGNYFHSSKKRAWVVTNQRD